MKRKLGLVFMMSLLALSPGMSQADPTYEHSKDYDQFFAADLGGVTGGVVTLGALAAVGAQRDTVNILEDAYKHDRVPYGTSGSGYIPGAGEPSNIAYQTLIVKDKELVRLKKEIADLNRESRRLDDFYLLQHFPRSSAVYKEVDRLRDKAEELTKVYDLRSKTIWSYYRNGAKYYKGNMLTADEINKIMALRENERLAWHQVMRDQISKEKKKMTIPTIASVLGLLGTSYAVLKGAEASQRIEKAKAEAQGGSNGAAQSQVAGAAAAR